MNYGHCHDNPHGHHGGGCCEGEGHHHDRFASRHGCHEGSFGMGFGRHFANREQMLAQLVDYQKDLEQRLADINDLVRHLTDTEQEQSATV
jgi:hypothetical protein